MADLAASVGYITALSLVTPPLAAWNLAQLQPAHGRYPLVRPLMRAVPGQWGLRAAQFTVATQVQTHTSPWVGFALMGTLQSVIYGHVSRVYTRAWSLPITQVVLFRGLGWGAARDVVSQGVPFWIGHHWCHRWTTLVASSIMCTAASQGLHNVQLTLQQHPTWDAGRAMSHLWHTHGRNALWRGVHARWLLMLAHNGLNHVFLHESWGHVEKPGATWKTS